jgi:hypothetical protein
MAGTGDMCRILAELPLAEGAPAHCASHHCLSSPLGTRQEWRTHRAVQMDPEGSWREVDSQSP